MMAGIDAVSKMCLWKLRKDEIPESEYGLNGNDQKDYVCVEMLKVQWVNEKNTIFHTMIYRVVKLTHGKLFRSITGKRWYMEFLSH